MKPSRKFDKEKTQILADEVALVLNKSGLSAIEMVYAIAATLKGIGTSLYDKDDISYQAVNADYSKNPSWPAAIILHAEQLPKIYELFVRERKEAEDN